MVVVVVVVVTWNTPPPLTPPTSLFWCVKGESELTFLTTTPDCRADGLSDSCVLSL